MHALCFLWHSRRALETVITTPIQLPLDLLCHESIKAQLVNASCRLAWCPCRWPVVRPGGVMMGDDYQHMWPGVIRAAKIFAARHGLKLHVEVPKWWVVKPTTFVSPDDWEVPQDV